MIRTIGPQHRYGAFSGKWMSDGGLGRFVDLLFSKFGPEATVLFLVGALYLLAGAIVLGPLKLLLRRLWHLSWPRFFVCLLLSVTIADGVMFWYLTATDAPTGGSGIGAIVVLVGSVAVGAIVGLVVLLSLARLLAHSED